MQPYRCARHATPRPFALAASAYRGADYERAHRSTRTGYLLGIAAHVDANTIIAAKICSSCQHIADIITLIHDYYRLLGFLAFYASRRHFSLAAMTAFGHHSLQNYAMPPRAIAVVSNVPSPIWPPRI